MAKQKGIHQIKGKVGDMSYYQSAGVPGGLIRRIPEGLSSRVKTADEYANTRLNNDEFKNAAGIAAFAFNAVPNRKSSMMRRFAVAAMIKEALQYIKAGSGNWGVRIPSATFDNILVDLLENHSKSGPYSGEFGLVSDEGTAPAIDLTLSADELVVSDLVDKGIDGFYVVSVRGAAAEVVVDSEVRQHFGVSSILAKDETITLGTSIEDSFNSFTPAPQTLGLSPAGYTAAQGSSNNGMFAIVTFLPYRELGSGRHVLNEYATFVCVPLGPIPTA